MDTTESMGLDSATKQQLVVITFQYVAYKVRKLTSIEEWQERVEGREGTLAYTRSQAQTQAQAAKRAAFLPPS